jgi:RNA polymerase sigma factor (sigma-70 family)
MLIQSPTPKHLEWAKNVAQRHHEALSRYAFGICRNRERAEDAVQETYVRLLKQDRRKIEAHIKPWLLRVCRSRILDLARKEGRMSLLDTAIMEHKPSNSPHPDEVAESHDLSQALLSYVDRLAPAQQEVLRLKFQSGLSYKEIADVTNKSVNHVGVILHQALKRLKCLVCESGEKLFNELEV